MTVDAALRAASRRLAEASFEDPRREARLLLASVGGPSVAEQLRAKTTFLTDTLRRAFDAAVERRLRHEPLAYIAGRVDFFGRSFVVSPSVLIPRPETEEVAAFALDLFDEIPFARDMINRRKDVSESRLNVLDIGTGSGCLGLTIALELQAKYGLLANLTLTDLSTGALAVARQNADMLAPDMRVSIYEADLWPPGGTFDLIVSNPPYVEAGDLAGLMPDVRDYEPALALDGGADGLDMYRRLAAEAGGFLAPDGLVVVEHGSGQRAAICQLFAAAYDCPAALTDLAGHERALCFCRRGENAAAVRR